MHVWLRGKLIFTCYVNPQLKMYCPVLFLLVRYENAFWFWFHFVFKTAGTVRVMSEWWSHCRSSDGENTTVTTTAASTKTTSKHKASKLTCSPTVDPQMIHAETKHCFLIVLCVSQSHIHTGFLSPFGWEFVDPRPDRFSLSVLGLFTLPAATLQSLLFVAHINKAWTRCTRKSDDLINLFTECALMFTFPAWVM